MDKLIQAIEGRRICRERNGYDGGKNDAIDMAVELIRAHMEGKVIVPVEPTDEMIKSASDWFNDDSERDVSIERVADCIYKAMLEATNAQ